MLKLHAFKEGKGSKETNAQGGKGWKTDQWDGEWTYHDQRHNQKGWQSNTWGGGKESWKGWQPKVHPEKEKSTENRSWMGVEELKLPEETSRRVNGMYDVKAAPWLKAPWAKDVWAGGEAKAYMVPPHLDYHRMVYEGEFDKVKQEQGFVDFSSGATGYIDKKGEIR